MKYLLSQQWDAREKFTPKSSGHVTTVDRTCGRQTAPTPHTVWCLFTQSLTSLTGDKSRAPKSSLVFKKFVRLQI